MLFISPLHITNERRNSTAKILPERRQIKFLDKPVFKFCEIVDFKNFKRIDENTFEFRGRFEIEGVEEVMGIDFDEETEQLTIGGYVFNLFGSLPEIGDKISDENCDYEVLRMDGTRVSLVKAIKKAVAQPQENEEAEKNN